MKISREFDKLLDSVKIPLKSTLKRSNRKYYPTRRIPQILRDTIITCSGRWHMVWLISSSAHMKTSKNGLIRE